MLRAIIFTLIFTLLMSNAAYAKTSPWDSIDEVQTRLIAGDAQHFGLQLKLKKHWHSYWRTPGDGGLPLTIDTTGSANIKTATLIYPAPKRFQTIFEGYDPIETYGYEHEVVFPIKVTPIDPSQPVRLNLKANYGVCQEICIFRNFSNTLTMTRAEIDSTSLALINSYIAKSSYRSTDVGMALKEISFLPDSQLKVLAVSSISDFNSPDLFIEGGDNVTFPKPEISINSSGNEATFLFNYNILLEGENISQLPLTFTLVNGDLVYEQTGTDLRNLQQVTTSEPASYSLLFYILFAILGGLILNIMPCVLPVLSLKVLSVMKHGGGNPSEVRSSFIMTSLGIITSFIVLAGIVITLKALGTTVGWGFHFQEPLFLIAIIIILNLFAANQWELFEFHMPTWLGGKMDKTIRNKDEHTAAGNFLTGAFATLMATPCSAPFLGTAISFALSKGTNEIFIIFFSMGVGLALPYLLFAATPKLVTKLPKPGMWMVRVKHFLGALLLATSIWLIWVLSNQLGFVSSALVAGLSLTSIGLLFAYKRMNALTLPLLLTIIAIGIPLTFYLPSKLAEMDETEKIANDTWIIFNEKDIARHTEDGNIVFVDITADWCLTCKVNKWNVLNDMDVVNALHNKNVVAMRGDISLPNVAISNYLQRNGRYGIPFNIVYGPSTPQGIALSELLTKEAVLEAIAKAK